MSVSVLTDNSYSVKFSKKEGDKIGVSFVEGTDGDITVAKVKSDGLAAGSNMKEGDKIISINGKSLDGMSSQSAAKALRASSGPIEILLEDATAEVDKEPAETAPVPVESVIAEDGEDDADGKDFNNCWGCIVQ